MDYLLAAIVGIGLAAACGLRAFVPVLALALAAKAGWVQLDGSFAWLSSWPAIAGLTLACCIELTASIAPFIAHALDALAAPVATAAGALVMASQVGPVGSVVGLPDVSSMDPMLSWGAALIAGGGVAAVVHATSAAARAGSTAISGGLLSPVYGALESILSVVASIMAVVVPILFAIAIAVIAFIAASVGILWILRRHRSRSTIALAAA